MATPELTNLADLIARLRLQGLQTPDTGPTPDDPENWLNIQAQLQAVGSSPEQYAGLQQAAQNALMAQGGYMPQTVDPALAQSDPAAANAMLRQNMVNQLMQLLQGQQGAYDAASAEVGQQYKDLTTPINTEGTAFLQELYKGLGIDPATDPTAQQFMTTLAQGQNTSQLNQATDQAWFDKMKANNLITTQGLIQGIADGSIPIPGEVVPEQTGGGGGGGGGGGRGRRGGRGGGGSGGGDWTNPKTTDAVTEAAAADAVFQYPGFREAFIGVGQTPEEQETARRIAATYGGLPYNVNKGLSSVELPNAEAAIDALTAQHAQRAAYQKVLGGGGRTAAYQNEFKPLAERAQMAENDPANNMPLNIAENERLKRLSEIQFSEGIAKFFNTLSAQSPSKTPYDAAHAKRTALQRRADMFKGVGRYRAQELDREAMEAAQRPYNESSNPTGQGKDFTFQGWPGYVPNIDRQDFADKWGHLDLLRRLTPIAEEFDPNAGWQETKYSQKDSSSTKTSQSSKAAQDQLFNNNTDPGYVPYSTDTSAASSSDPEFQEFGGGGAGFGMGVGFSEAAKRIVARRAKRERDRLGAIEASAPTSVEEVVEQVASQMFNKPSKKPAPKKQPAKKAPAPKTAPEAIKEMGANLFGPPKKVPTLIKKSTPKQAVKKNVKKTLKGLF